MDGSLKRTIAVSLTNYLDAGAIVAGASGLTLWQKYLGLSEVHLGWLNFISANCLGAALGAIIGGVLADKYGRKFIYTYNLIVYMVGVLLILCSVNFPMLLAGFLVTGISVGIGVPASWTYISESSEIDKRGRNICISQMSWGVGPMIILLLGMFFAPGGYLFSWVEALAHAIGGAGLAGDALNVFSSRVVFFSLFVVAFIAWNMQRKLEESGDWKATREAAKAKGEDTSLIHAFGVLFSNKIALKTVFYLVTIYLTWNLVASVMGFFQPHIYETAGGVDNEQANWMNCIQWAIIVATTFVLSGVIDHQCMGHHRRHRCEWSCGTMGIRHPLGHRRWCVRPDFLCPVGLRTLPCQIPCRSTGTHVLHRTWSLSCLGTRIHLHLRRERRRFHHCRLLHDCPAGYLPCGRCHRMPQHTRQIIGTDHKGKIWK